jgi:hypothetical protein
MTGIVVQTDLHDTRGRQVVQVTRPEAVQLGT